MPQLYYEDWLQFIVAIHFPGGPTPPSSTTRLIIARVFRTGDGDILGNFFFPQDLEVITGNLYIVPAEASDAQFVRFPLNDFVSDAELSIPLPSPYGTNPDFMSAGNDGTYLYLYPSASLVGGGFHSMLRRVLVSDFSTIDTLLFDTYGPNIASTSGEGDGFNIVPLNGWLYLYNLSGNAASLVRVNLSDFSTVQTLDLGATWSVTIRSHDCFTDGTYIYVIGSHGAAPAATELYRVDPTTFTVVDRLELWTGAQAGVGVASEGFAYIAPPRGYAPVNVRRINLSTFSTVEERDTDTGTINGGAANGLAVAGKYVYYAERSGGAGLTRVVAVDRTVSDWTTAEVVVKSVADLEPSVEDGSGFSAFTTDGEALYGMYGFTPLILLKLALFDGTDLTKPATPDNDNFANAIALTVGTAATGADFKQSDLGFGPATSETGEPAHAGGDGNNTTVWWKFTPGASGNYKIDLAGSEDTGNGWVVAVYTGNAVDALTEVISLADYPTPSVTFAATGGTTYHIAVDGWTGGPGYFGAFGAIRIEATGPL